MPKQLERDFNHHPPVSAEDGARHEDVRLAIKASAAYLDGKVPDGREKAVMHTKLEEAMFWANAGIARSRYDNK